MTLEDKVHAFRLHVVRRAKELGNVSAACREAGISRTVFYRWKQQFVLYGSDGLRPRQTGARPGPPPQLAPTEEKQIIAAALAWPTWGPEKLSLQLVRHGLVVSSTTVWQPCAV
jgi:transposase-like protein